ncbi:MAG: replication-associated recombination protein A [Muribaculaceae bacterium]|nr:replication-associated recombination protein A [Muribaculaceae bacterium]
MNEPLASKLRPARIEDYYGQRHILAQGTMLRRMVESDRVGSMILYGPPGTGKTSLANVIAKTTSAQFLEINATTAGKKDMQDAVKDAQAAAKSTGQKTILFIDEIHRFNKAQQDFLLPFVENGTIILIGATTENPFFEVNKALVSRCAIFELKPVGTDEIRRALDGALGYIGKHRTEYPPVRAGGPVLDFFAEMAAGDVRHAYNALELAVLSTPPSEDGAVEITLEIAQQCMQRKHINYDKNGDSHYDTISAFIKSMRGSDPDAVLYYLARLISAGEDPKFIARRIMIHACEDVGLANPMAIVVAEACCSAAERIGFPEAQIILAEAALYVAASPKSNSSAASISRAMELARFASDLEIPNHLKDAHYAGAKKLNRGIGYKYPHDFEGHWVQQDYLPEKLRGVQLYMRCEADVPVWPEKQA